MQYRTPCEFVPQILLLIRPANYRLDRSVKQERFLDRQTLALHCEREGVLLWDTRLSSVAPLISTPVSKMTTISDLIDSRGASVCESSTNDSLQSNRGAPNLFTSTASDSKDMETIAAWDIRNAKTPVSTYEVSSVWVYSVV